MSYNYFNSNRDNNLGEQGAEKLVEGLSKLINISNLTLKLRLFHNYFNFFLVFLFFIHI
jgi:hypothetical protein